MRSAVLLQSYVLEQVVSSKCGRARDQHDKRVTYGLASNTIPHSRRAPVTRTISRLNKHNHGSQRSSLTQPLPPSSTPLLPPPHPTLPHQTQITSNLIAPLFTCHFPTPLIYPLPNVAPYPPLLHHHLPVLFTLFSLFASPPRRPPRLNDRGRALRPFGIPRMSVMLRRTTTNSILAHAANLTNFNCKIYSPKLISYINVSYHEAAINEYSTQSNETTADMNAGTERRLQISGPKLMARGFTRPKFCDYK